MGEVKFTKVCQNILEYFFPLRGFQQPFHPICNSVLNYQPVYVPPTSNHLPSVQFSLLHAFHDTKD